MFGSETLDIAIGLVLVFLLVSLMLTAVTEAIEAMLKTRAADLERAIGLMLENTKASQDILQKADNGTSETAPATANQLLTSEGSPDASDKTGKATSETAPATANQPVTNFYNHPLIFSLFKGDYGRTSTRWWSLGRKSGGDLPSYIPRELFSTVALDIVGKDPLVGIGPAQNELRAVVEKLKVIYGEDTNRLKVHLESWYDGVMDRTSGWYKRRTHTLLFWLGLLTAIVLNINPIVIAQYLAQNPQARDQLAQMASQVAEAQNNEAQAAAAAAGAAAGDAENAASPAADAADKAAEVPEAAGKAPPAADSTEKASEAAKAKKEQQQLADAAGDAAETRVACAKRGAEWSDVIACQKAIAQVGLPIGWEGGMSGVAWQRTFPAYPDPAPNWTDWWCWILAWAWALVIALFGWSLTGLAATLGAPFWFDTLNKIMVIRSTVKPKEKSGDESSEDRTAPKPAVGAERSNVAARGIEASDIPDDRVYG